MTGGDPNAPQRKDGVLEVALLCFNQFKAEVFDAGFIENDEIRTIAFRCGESDPDHG